MMILLYFLLLLVLPVSISAQHICPCKCTKVIDGWKVECSGKPLKKIFKYLPDATVELYIRNASGLNKLFRRHLSGLQYLRNLNITASNITYLEKNLLDEAPRLTTFTLSQNPNERLPVLSSRQHFKLKTLDLSGNRLSQLPARLLWTFPHLGKLILSSNNIQTLPSGFFDYSKYLHTLYLDGNPLNCDCRWLHQISYIQQRIPEHMDSKQNPCCIHPPELSERSLMSLRENELRCYEAMVLFKDSGERKINLKCAHGWSDSSVVWLYSGKKLAANESSLQLNPDGTITADDTFDTKNFLCAFDLENKAKRIRRQAGMAPQFTLKPKDRAYREGSTVRLDCEVTGRPRPTVRWYFEGKKLKRTRKYEMNFEQTNLNIYPFLEKDVGTYKCVAENPYGRIEASARVAMISSSPPVIIEIPEDQTVNPGTTVVFKCSAIAEPRPFITWFMDGSEIPLLKGHFHVSDDETELTISDVTKRDEGVYSCMAGNTVGSMIAEARLTVNIHGDHRQQNRVDDRFIYEIFQQASTNVDSAIEETREKLSKLTSPRDLMRWYQYSFPRTIELNRAREIYEESIRLVQKHVEKGLQLQLDELPMNLSFESVLTKSHVDMLMQLAGCEGALTKDPCNDQCFHKRYRTYDGQCNNVEHPLWGAARMRFRRLLPPIYENGFNTPVGWNRDKLYFGYRKPNPRSVSRKLLSTLNTSPHENYSSMLMQWGQFIDHDLDFTAAALSRHAFATGAICNRTCENINPCFNIQLDSDDPRMYENPPYPCIEFERSSAVCGSGETSLIYRQVTYREQMNIITSYIDGSGIYGSSEEDAYELREFNPDRGLLRFDIVSSTNKPYMPFERDSPMDCRRNFTFDHPVRCFLAGDYRANEQLGLMSMHTIFIREHNRIAEELGRINPGLDGETIYQEARKIVGAEIQHITYHEWLPKVLGQAQYDELIGPYRGYQPLLDASVSNAFATAAFRFGHTLVNPILYRLNEEFKQIREGHISLGDAFFVPEELLNTGGVDPYLRGLFASAMKKPTPNELMNIEFTENLFSRAHEVALDLASMNIQRGRDHALPGYVEYRKWCNLSPVNNWDDLHGTIPDNVIYKLRILYGHPGNIDLFAGGIAEERHGGALIGPTFSCIIAEQFRRVRDGDRFWYEKSDVFTDGQREEIEKTSLSAIICNNADRIDRIQKDVFLYPGKQSEYYGSCARIRQLDLRPWQSCCYRVCSIDHNRYRRVQKRK